MNIQNTTIIGDLKTSISTSQHSNTNGTEQNKYPKKIKTLMIAWFIKLLKKLLSLL